MTKGSNKVHYPQRPKISRCETLRHFKETANVIDEIEHSHATNPNKLLVIDEPDYKSMKSDVYFSNEISLDKLKKKSKSLKVTINDILVGSVIKAVKDITNNTQEDRALIQFVMNTAPSDKNLDDFEPSNEVVAASVIHYFKETLKE